MLQSSIWAKTAKPYRGLRMCGGRGPWPLLAPASLLEFDACHVYRRHLCGPSTTELYHGVTQVRERAEALRLMLVERFELIYGTAFPHTAR